MDKLKLEERMIMLDSDQMIIEDMILKTMES